jgi:hypothetical protein
LKRWRELRSGKEDLGGLVDFHTRNKPTVKSITAPWENSLQAARRFPCNPFTSSTKG